ncbi:MAG: MCP four helix bundle domain-containing protein [Planctomycetes bacterium]|nr:MCP four helix bundle domain-containing protein [Planctomycetota bacterium]
MGQAWTFGRKMAVGFAAIAGLTVLIGGVAAWALHAVVAAKDRVIDVNCQSVADAQTVNTEMARKVASLRGFLLTREERFLQEVRERRSAVTALLARLHPQVDSAEAKRLLDQVDRTRQEYDAAADKVIALRKTEASQESVIKQFDDETLPRRDAMVQALDQFSDHARAALADARQAATNTATFASTLILTISGLAIVLAIAAAGILSRALTRQIGSAVQHVQSSSAELQTAASQQTTGAKEQATAMTEITTTISELLATSKQIAESAQRVAQIADDAAGAARAGDQTVQKTHESVAGIKREVDLIVTHMLDLGKKSQQIGGILEIINELAEQTNILAINATIEAAGAGEAGKRFGVVADEIRKLADRVGGSAKEIRALIDEIRSAVNTTVMATEGGSKAVDAGARQFGEVAASFRHIAGLVGTITEAAREIELSTKQQASAVEQVNLAVANTAQAAKETETSSNQTFQTASQLTNLSRDLTRLIQPNAG